MSKITYKQLTNFNTNEIINLYADAQWTNYTNNPKKLIRAFENSLLIYAAYLHDQLVGLIRIIGDEETIIYVQDLLVLQNYQRQKIASNLLSIILNRYKDVRQVILLTDNQDSLKKFYASNGFKEVSNLNAVSFMYIQ